MRIEFDRAKDSANQTKHGVSLDLAEELDWDAALIWIDDRFDNDEWRMIALAPKTGILYYVAFVDRGEVRRIISLRRANRREVNTMSKVSKRPSIAMPTSKEDKAITAAAKSDPDARPLTPKQLKSMVPLRALRGRPKSGNAKQLVSVRYSPEVLAYFKSTGEGWQSRMDGVLREYVTRHSRRARG
ncbi:MAG TPA: BrnT family toxin [Burkholderiales bacterium]|nr:BrnT family toxin [Burkholderiales bacterium]